VLFFYSILKETSSAVRSFSQQRAYQSKQGEENHRGNKIMILMLTTTPSMMIKSMTRHPINRLCGSAILLLLIQVLGFELPTAASLSLLSPASAASQKTGSGMNSLTKDMGELALEKVQWLGGLVSNTDNNNNNNNNNNEEEENNLRRKQNVEGTGGTVYNNFGFAKDESLTGRTTKVAPQRPKEKQVWTALAVLERDSKCSSSILLLKKVLTPWNERRKLLSLYFMTRFH
jgi:hypothetical protein